MPGDPSAATTSAAPCRSAASPRSGHAYQRREVESTTLYQVVQGHIETFYQAVEDGFASAALPNFVKQEFERFLAQAAVRRARAGAPVE